MNSSGSGTNEETVGSYSPLKGVTFGAIGGLIAGLVMAGIGYAIPVPGMMGEPFFINSADMWNLSNKVTTGWTLHIVASLGIGIIFGMITSRVSILRASSMAKGLVLGPGHRANRVHTSVFACRNTSHAWTCFGDKLSARKPRIQFGFWTCFGGHSCWALAENQGQTTE